jgi:Trk K+ transport system NAD-binding subunit
VAELSRGLPEDSLLISIRRAGGEIVFPHGNTRLCEGDRLFAFARREQTAAMRRLFEDE